MNEKPKKIQYALFVLLLCSLLVLPAVGETLPGENVSPGDGIANANPGPEVTSTDEPTAATGEGLEVTSTDEPTAANGEEPEGTSTDEPTAANGEEPEGTSTDEPTAANGEGPEGTPTVEPMVTAEEESDDESIGTLSGGTVLFNGTVALDDGTFECTAYNSGETYTVSNRTPLGALQKVSEQKGFTYNVTDKRWAYDEVLLLDDIDGYLYIKKTAEWACYVNGELKDGYGNHDDGLNVVALAEGDEVVFCYGSDPTPETATALITITVGLEDSDETPLEPATWSVSLIGARTEEVDQDYFERGVNCGHAATYTDDNGKWSGMPLWYLVGLVDDIETSDHWTFNDDLAAEGYSIKVTSSDNYSINFDSASVARNDGIIVANTLNGTELPETIGEKPYWPLRIVGPNVSAGQKIGGIAEIELIGLSEPSEGWEITLSGAFNRTLTQAEFEEGAECHGTSYTDGDEQVWTGIPLWYLAAVVDDVATGNHWKLNNTRADEGYTVRVSAADGFNTTFSSADIARNNSFIVANKMNAAPLTEDNGAPLKLVGTGVTSGKQRIGKIATITLEGLPDEVTESEWTLSLEGPKVTDLLTKEEFEECGYHTKTYNDGVSTWSGVPLKVLCGWVDDDVMHGSGAFNTALAQAGYTVIVSSGGDNPYSKEFSSRDILTNPNNYIVANMVNGTPLTGSAYPLRLVGEGAVGSKSVGNVQRIQLVDFQEPTEPPSIRVVRYAPDGVTVVNETTKTIQWMEANLDVIGGDNGVRLRFQGPTFDPDDLWNPEESKNLGKVDEVVKGTAIRDLCDLVGGVPEGGEIELIASDGYEAKLNYTNIYEPLERQGEAIVAWWTERQGYVPNYSDGPRLFFNTSDGIFGNDDMRTCLAEDYWHYYWDNGIQYPSAAGVSNKKIATIAIKPGAREDWKLLLTGAITDTITRSYFESGKACTMGGHGATWTDDEGQVWSGMPLWLLCGWVDDGNKHDYGTNPFRDDLAAAGYNVTVIDYGADGIKGTDDDFSATFNSSFVARNNNIIVADEIDGAPLPADGEKPPWPLKLVGSALTSNKQRVGSIDEIVLTGVPVVEEPPEANATISLEEGWNFISTPKRLVDGSDTFAAIYGSVDTAGHSILLYDGLTQEWKAAASADAFKPLDGVWVYANETCTVPLTFAPARPETPPTKDLGEGWNAIGFTDTVPESAANTLLSLGDHWTTLIGFDAGSQEYEVSIIRGATGRHGEERTMEPMQGYWVYMTDADTLAAIGA
jgi:DMSO/TMAO reductase YedYZ molybdopterin-dependent catalytic subunit